MNRKLTIVFSNEDSSMLFNSGQKVVIIRQTEHSIGIAPAWVCFRPFVVNGIDWEDKNFSIYSSTSKIEYNTTVIKHHEEEAVPSIRHDYWDGPFNPPSKSVFYYARNLSNKYPQMTFGLSQSVLVKGETYSNLPINAFSVPFRHSVEMEPGNLINVSIRKNVVNSMLLPYETNGILLNYNEATEYRLVYEDNRLKISDVFF